MVSKVKDTSRFCHIYKIRSNVEHMHHPLRNLNISIDFLKILSKQIEKIARELINYFPLNQFFWDNFKAQKTEGNWIDYDFQLRDSWIFNVEIEKLKNV